MANRPLTVTSTADSNKALHDAIVGFAECMDNPDLIAAIRLGDCYAEMDLLYRPMDPKQLH